MAKQIRLLMKQENGKFIGIVEADETYIGGRRPQAEVRDNKTAVVGISEKRGQIKAKAIGRAVESTVMPYLLENIEELSVLHTDKSMIYLNALASGFKHLSVRHGYKHYVENGVHTNNIECFWGQLKRSINGTYHVVSPKYLQLYVDEFCFRFNHRYEQVCPALLAKV